jgi:carboxymethylenebutenolidase
MYPSLVAHEVSFAGDGGEVINAYYARPDPAHLGDGRYPGVVVLHHLLGLDEGTMEIVRKFAAHGYITVCPNLHSREAREHGQENAWAASRAAGGVPDQRLVGDLAGALSYLRASDGSSGKVGVIGYCSGGRQAFLGACSLPMDAAVDCYGSFVTNETPKEIPLRFKPLLHLAGNLSCPMLGVFGGHDPNPSPADAQLIAETFASHGKHFELLEYPEAGHGFFAADREDHYNVKAATDGWQQVFAFFERNLH